jgi:uncharacterized protein (TIGR02145 family)
MKSKFIFTSVLAVSTVIAFAQRPTMELTFTAVNNTDWLQLDSIKVMNRTQGGDTVLYYPDTILVLDFQVGVPEASFDTDGFQVFQNYPNPVAGQTTISLFVPEKDQVSIIVTDILGRVIVQAERVLDKGKHSFRFTTRSGNLYFFTAQWQGGSSSIKMLNLSSGGHASSLEYLGGKPSSPVLKVTKEVQEFFFSPGDELLYIGYADTLQSGVLDLPEESTTYTFQFATNIPCPGTPTVEYEGQVYNTIQIYSQCWLKENLNVGETIPGTMAQTDNGIIEKYCYDNEPDSCVKYGGLYQWAEMMQYTTQEGVQGICPQGWHLPADEEWKVLEGAVDSQYGIGDPEWDLDEFRGFDAGANLKATSGWYSGGNGTDMYEFTGMPHGRRVATGVFSGINSMSPWWTSTGTESSATHHLLSWMSSQSRRLITSVNGGHAIRCLKDE